MPKKTCQNPQCSKEFKARASRKFCSQDCFNNYVKNSKRENSKQELDSTSSTTVIATSQKSSIEEVGMLKMPEWKYPRRCIKQKDGTWKLVMDLTWEEANGPVPSGYIVVSKNNDTFDDQNIRNLKLLTKREYEILLLEEEAREKAKFPAYGTTVMLHKDVPLPEFVIDDESDEPVKPKLTRKKRAKKEDEEEIFEMELESL